MKESKFSQADMSALKELFQDTLSNTIQSPGQLSIKKAWETIQGDMEIGGLSDRTIADYHFHLFKMCKVNNYESIDEITRDGLITYIKGKNDIKEVTQSNRIKAIKPVLNRMHDRGWIQKNFWKDLRVKVKDVVKEGASQEEVFTLLSLLDLTNYSEFRDACAVLLMWETGVRVGTVGRLTTSMIDYDNNLIHFEGKTMKNYKTLSLPISNELANMLQYLTDRTTSMLKELDKESDLVFVTQHGNSVRNTTNNNTISKRLSMYARRFNLKHISPHDIRRGFGKRLYKEGVKLPIISRALNHSSLDVTTKYLHIENEEVIDELRQLNK